MDLQTQGTLRTQKTGLEKNITVQTSELLYNYLEQSIEFWFTVHLFNTLLCMIHVVIHTCNVSTWEPEAGGLTV